MPGLLLSLIVCWPHALHFNLRVTAQEKKNANLFYSNSNKNKWIFYGLKDLFITKSFIFSGSTFIYPICSSAVFIFFPFSAFNKYAASFQSSCESLPIGAAYSKQAEQDYN